MAGYLTSILLIESAAEYDRQQFQMIDARRAEVSPLQVEDMQIGKGDSGDGSAKVAKFALWPMHNWGLKAVLDRCLERR